MGVVVLHHDDPVHFAHFGPGGRIVTASDDKTAKVWDASGKLWRTLVGHTGAIVEAVFSADGRLVLTASVDGTARLWKTETGALVTSFDGHRQGFMRARFTPDGRFAVTASSDGGVRFWRLPSAGDGHHGAVVQALLLEDSSIAFTRDDEGCTLRWDLSRPGSPSGGTGCVENMLAPGIMTGGPWTVVGGEGATFWIWGSGGQAQRAQLSAVNRPLRALGLDANDGRLMTVDARFHLDTWALPEPHNLSHQTLAPQKPIGEIWDVQFSADGQRVVTACTDGMLAEWDSRSFLRKRELAGVGGPLHTVDVSAKGDYIVGSGGEGLRVWRSNDDQPVFDFSNATSRRLPLALTGPAWRPLPMDISASGTSRPSSSSRARRQWMASTSASIRRASSC